MKKLITFLIFLLGSLGILSAQTKELKKLVKVQDNLMEIDKKTYKEKPAEKFFKLFNMIRDDKIEKSFLNGDVSFGFNGDQSSQKQFFNKTNNSIYNLNGSLKLARENYPSKLEIATDFNVQINNGKLIENLSNLNISYDRHFSSKHPLLLESYAFISRRSDQFLGIDQRYEIGSGLIIAHWSRNYPDKVKSELKTMKEAFKNFKSVDSIFIHCIDSCIRVGTITQEDLNDLYKLRENLKYAKQKEASPLRIGLLAGLFLELENTNFKDSLATDGGMMEYTKEFTPTTRLRWELRPTFDFKILENAVGVKIRPYLKFPMPWDWEREVEGNKQFDFRMDFPVSVKVKVKDDFFVELQHVIYYDNTPSSELTTFISPDGQQVFATLNQWHQITTFKIGFELK